jgi:hypothetical protein
MFGPDDAMPLVSPSFRWAAAGIVDPKIALIVVYFSGAYPRWGKESLWIQAYVNALGSFGPFL